MTRFSCVLVGDDSLLAGCGGQLVERGHTIRAVVTQDPQLRDWAADHGIALLDTPEALGANGVEGFDWLFSIANLTVIPSNILALAKRGAINFHDGPLPGMAGLNTPVWALLEGAQTHAVTWHMMEAGIDTGDIVATRDVAIAGDETAHSLNSKCYAAALDSFAALVSQIETSTLSPRPQEQAGRRYFAGTRRPAGAGYLDFTRPAAELAQMVRALDFGGYWNPLGLPRLLVGNETFFVREAALDGAAGYAAPGEVTAISDNSLRVATPDGAVRLSKIIDATGQVAALRDRLETGDTLPALDAAQAADAQKVAERLARHQGFWRARLAKAQPVTAPLASSSHTAPDWTSETVALPDALGRDATVAILAAWALQGAGQQAGDVAYVPAELADACAHVPAIAAPWVPLGLGTDADTMLKAAADALAAVIDAAHEHGGFPADLPLRDPALSGLHAPQVAITEGAEPPAGAVIAAILGRDGTCTLKFDRTRLDDNARALLRARLDAMIERATATPAEALRMADLRALPQGERDRLIHDWNDSGADYDASVTIHRAFELQTACTPNATALVFEDESLSYAELNARANRAARALQAAGVGRNVHVGLCLRRSPDLVVGALAILKAGGAYVPLDPDHPASRLEHVLRDSGARVVLAHGATADLLPDTGAKIIRMEEIATTETGNVDGGSGPDDLAYLIYTSGSTGQPKGVMVTHRNVANFFCGMDAHIDRPDDAVWMAVTSIGFDISVLELFHTLSRGFKVVIAGDETRAAVSNAPIAASGRPMDFSIFFWGNDDGPGRQKYELLLDAARYADANGFAAIWTPERHFHAFGGPYPNPAVSGAAVAAVTGNIGVRAGSIVAPLHHPARIAEDWAVIDNLTNGRAGLGMASGWHPHDFVLRPENCPPDNKRALFDALDKLRRLWRGEEVEFPDRDGKMIPVKTLPRPVSEAPECWITIAGNPDTWREAGEHGAHVLTHLLGQSIDEVAEKIKLYHAALRGAGHDPADFKVTLMLHSFIAEDRETARKVAHGPMKSYLASAAGLIKQFAWVFPAFKRPEGVNSPFEMDLDTLDAEEIDAILEFAFDRYFEESGLFGTVEDGVARAEQLKKIGVTEIACLVDYGIEPPLVMEGITRLKQVMDAANAPASLADDDFSVAAQIIRHGVTHLQCTPSMARILTENDEARTALRGLRQLLIGGEAFPADLADKLRSATGARILNMYGPTETTIWSTCHEVRTNDPGPILPIGGPIANTRLYVLDETGALAPVGVPGELCIAGDGVARGYWRRDDLSAERFVPDPFGDGTARMYRTGDIARRTADGGLEFLGRNDHQVKIRGHRIELGDIEAALRAAANATEAVVVARKARTGDLRLAGYFTAPQPVDEDALRARLRATLPEAMVPTDLMQIDAMPLTPNKKIDRSALPEPARKPRRAVAQPVSAADASDTERRIAAIWTSVLGVSQIGPGDNFFDLGGHSLLAVQAHRGIREAFALPTLAISDIFRFPVLRDLARHIDGSGGAPEPVPVPEANAEDRAATMSKRRAMRAGRERQPS